LSPQGGGPQLRPGAAGPGGPGVFPNPCHPAPPTLGGARVVGQTTEGGGGGRRTWGTPPPEGGPQGGGGKKGFWGGTPVLFCQVFFMARGQPTGGGGAGPHTGGLGWPGGVRHCVLQAHGNGFPPRPSKLWALRGPEYLRQVGGVGRGGSHPAPRSTWPRGGLGGGGHSFFFPTEVRREIPRSPGARRVLRGQREFTRSTTPRRPAGLRAFFILLPGGGGTN